MQIEHSVSAVLIGFRDLLASLSRRRALPYQPAVANDERRANPSLAQCTLLIGVG